jgi:murein DD-endopeptidase MepM/ murein hydrolase activator NlpD
MRQRRQIQEFATEISDLKTQLVELNNFEKKIRIIANIEKPEQDGLFGIGGSIPEDLDASIPLTQKHNSLLRDMHEQVDQLRMASDNQNSGFQTLFRFLKDQQNLLASTPAIRPCQGWTTSRFGYRKSPFTGRREFHKGYDIANREGTPISCTADGVVTYRGPKGLLGNMVIVDHGHGLVTRYGHLSKILVKRGQTVKRGDKLALMGNTGRSTGPHLHYEVHLNGIPVNPEKYMLN